MRARAAERPSPWTHKKKKISVEKINHQIDAWADYLGLADWNIAFSPVKADKNCRSSVLVFQLIHSATIQIDSRVPVGQMDRQIVHELLHVMFSGMEDAFDRAVELLPKKTRRVHDLMWRRGDEWVIERLTDVITGTPRTEWSSGEPWLSAFPPL